MGAPKRIRKKYERPTKMWNIQRIQRDHDLKEKYGLKNQRELWMLDSELRRIRKNVRLVLSGKLSSEAGQQIVARLSRYGIVTGTATLDELLTLSVEPFLERRLETLVLRKGLARSMKQARQLVVHGNISINSKKVTSPGRLVLANEEQGIAYYKPISVMVQQVAPSVPGAAPAAGAAAPEAAPAPGQVS